MLNSTPEPILLKILFFVFFFKKKTRTEAISSLNINSLRGVPSPQIVIKFLFDLIASIIFLINAGRK